MLSGDPFSPVSAVKYNDKQGNHFGDQDETGLSRRRVQIPGTTGSGIRLQKTWTTLKGQLPKGRMPTGHFPGTVPPFSRRLPTAWDVSVISSGVPTGAAWLIIMSSPTSSMFAAKYWHSYTTCSFRNPDLSFWELGPEFFGTWSWVFSELGHEFFENCTWVCRKSDLCFPSEVIPCASP